MQRTTRCTRRRFRTASTITRAKWTPVGGRKEDPDVTYSTGTELLGPVYDLHGHTMSNLSSRGFSYLTSLASMPKL